jgi:hypothetical protein
MNGFYHPLASLQAQWPDIHKHPFIVDRLTKKKKFIPMASLSVDALVQAFVEYA